MKIHLALFLMVTYCTSVSSSDEETKGELLKTAASQLERLAPFRKTKQIPENYPDNFKDLFRYYANKTNQETPRTSEKFEQLQLPLQLLQMISNTPMKGSKSALDRRRDALESNSNFFQDGSYNLFTQESNRRATGSDSGSFISGIVNKVFGGIFGTSTGLSSSSSGSSSSSSSSDPPDSYGNPGYGQPTYGKQSFSYLDFQNAILNTVFQAVKAISGGVIALGGQLIKGGGFLVSTKGRLISSTGEIVTGLGSKIASSTYVVAPKPVYSDNGYAYNPPSSQTENHDDSYEGQPPGSNDYSPSGVEDSYQNQNHFGAGSDDDVQAGLVIMTAADFDHHEDNHHMNHQNIQTLEEGFGVPGKGPNAQSSYQELPNFQLPSAKPPPSFGSSNHQNFLNNVNNNLEYQMDIPKIPLPISETNPSNSLHINYPPHTSAQNSDHQSQIAFQSTKFKNEKLPLFLTGTSGFDFSKLPTYDQLNTHDIIGSQTSDFPGPIISGIPINFGGQESLKIPILNELPKEHGQNFQQNIQIGNGPFPLETLESFGSKQFGDSIYGGKLISSSFQIQPSVGYTLKDSGLHRI